VRNWPPGRIVFQLEQLLEGPCQVVGASYQEEASPEEEEQCQEEEARCQEEGEQYQEEEDQCWEGCWELAGALSGPKSEELLVAVEALLGEEGVRLMEALAGEEELLGEEEDWKKGEGHLFGVAY
jgi:hypothetical protein